MDRGVYAIVSGAIVQERRMDVVARNLANSQTVGYKGEKILFTTVLAKSVAGSHQPKTQGDKVFSRISGTAMDWKGGTARQTGNTMDLALEGKGLFVIQTPNGPEYTRSGNFIVNQTRQLATMDGMPVLGQSGPMVIPPGKLLVNPQGEVTVDGGAVDTLKVMQFKDLASATRAGERFKGAVEPSPETMIVQGNLEESNVNAIEQMIAMVDLNRQYEAAQKVIQSMDDATKQAVNDLARPV
ncbi:MAG TPA: flagellar hook basal-body protein [Nitrospirales bacterium]